jgi:DNA anti-recombination protein RmuC
MDKIRHFKAYDMPEGIESKQLLDIKAVTGNLYKSLAVISKRANEIGIDLKEEINKKLEEFASSTDTLEEVLENREQIEISKFYENLPHSTIIALQEFMDGKLQVKGEEQEEKEEVQEEK